MEIGKNKKIGQPSDDFNISSGKKSVYIPALHKETKDTVELSSTKKQQPKSLVGFIGKGLKKLANNIMNANEPTKSSDKRTNFDSQVASEEETSKKRETEQISVSDTPVVVTREIFEENLNNTDIPSYEKKFILEYVETDEQMAVFNKLFTNPDLMSSKPFTANLTKCISNIRTPEQLQILDKFLSHSRLYKTEALQKEIIHILQCTFSQDDADSTLAMFDKIISIPNFDEDKEVQSCATKVLLAATDENKSKIAEEVLSNINLYKNPLMLDSIMEALHSVSSPKQAQYILAILQKLPSIPEFEKNTGLQESIGSIMKRSSSQKKTDLALKFLSNPELYENPNLQKTIINILSFANTDEKIDIANKFLSDSSLYNSKFYQKNIAELIYQSEIPMQAELINKILSNNKLSANKGLQIRLNDILKNSKTKESLQTKIDVIDKFLSDERLYGNESLQNALGSMVYFTGSTEKAEFEKQIMDRFLLDSQLQENVWLKNNLGSIFTYANTKDKKEVMQCLMDNPEELANLTNQLSTAKEKVLAHPELYVNGEYDSVDDMQKEIMNFYDRNSVHLLLAYKYLGKEAVDNILRMRLASSKECLNQITRFGLKELELLQELCNSKDTNGNAFNAAQKVQFINLISAYKDNGLEYTEIEKMISENNVDLETLNRNLFKKVMIKMGIPEEKIELIPDEKLTSWDTKYMHLLAKELKKEEDSNTFTDLINAANFEDFSEYIHDEQNKYGIANAGTKAEFEKLGLDYDAWINPSQDSTVHFVTKDKNQEQLSQVTTQIIEDIEALRKTPLKGIIDKRFKNFIKGDEFIIPNEISSNKEKLESFTKNIIEQLDDVWKRAQGNLDNPQKTTNARNTLTILDHLNQRINDLDAVDTSSGKTKTLDVTIKMWDRIPQKDIFQGNYSTCCIGMDGGNGSAMPHYLLNTAYNMIEIVDNKTGNVIGNALCYMATDQNGNPMFIIDNIEVSNSHKTSSEVGKELRAQITEYASRVAQQVTGKDDVPIYMSSSYNDVPIDDLPRQNDSVKLLGQVECDSIYMDLYGGWVDPAEEKQTELLRLK